eukprot:2121734-Rhodomonas_salina.3
MCDLRSSSQIQSCDESAKCDCDVRWRVLTCGARAGQRAERWTQHQRQHGTATAWRQDSRQSAGYSIHTPPVRYVCYASTRYPGTDTIRWYQEVVFVPEGYAQPLVQLRDSSFCLGISLCAPYAMSGTDTRYASGISAICLRVCYAISC